PPNTFEDLLEVVHPRPAPLSLDEFEAKVKSLKEKLEAEESSKETLIIRDVAPNPKRKIVRHGKPRDELDPALIKAQPGLSMKKYAFKLAAALCAYFKTDWPTAMNELKNCYIQMLNQHTEWNEIRTTFKSPDGGVYSVAMVPVNQNFH